MKIRLIMALLPIFAVLMCRADGCSSGFTGTDPAGGL